MALTDSTRPRGGIASAFWMVLLLLAAPLIALIFFKGLGRPVENVEDKRATARREKLAALRESDRAKLDATAWVDEAKGVVQIPVKEAIQLTLVELQNKVPKASAVKVQNPQAAAESADATAAGAKGVAAPPTGTNSGAEGSNAGAPAPMANQPTQAGTAPAAVQNQPQQAVDQPVTAPEPKPRVTTPHASELKK